MKPIALLPFLMVMVALASCGGKKEHTSSDSIEQQIKERWKETSQLDSMNDMPKTQQDDNNKKVSVASQAKRLYTQHEQNAIMDTISSRLSKCDALSGCISMYGIVADGIEVRFIYNTPERQRLFRQKIYDAPILNFVGPESPARMTKVGVNDTLGISLRPTKQIFPLASETVTFTLTNNGNSELTCGEECEIAFLDKKGVWHKLPRNEFVNDIGYEVRSGKSRIICAKLSHKAFPTPATRFRFFYPVRYNGQNITLMTEFATQ